MSTPSDCAVTDALIELSAGQIRAESVERLYQHVMLRLINWAKFMLGRVPRSASDEEDVALTTFHSFCVLAVAGRFGPLEDLDQLWPILYTLTRGETSGLRRYVYAEKRDPRRVIEVSLEAIPDPKPNGQEVTDWVDERETLMDDLDDASLRKVASMIYEGWTNGEIAEQIHRNVRTVKRNRMQIRMVWERELTKWDRLTSTGASDVRSAPHVI